MRALQHYAKLLGSSLVLIFVVILIMFLLLEAAPGDPIQALVGQVPVSEEFRRQMTEQFGLDRPVWERFFAYVGNILTGNLGYSFATMQPVSELILGRLGNTLLLTLPALVISSILGILLGAVAARTRSKALDGAISYAAIAGFSLPAFWVALLLILLFSVNLGWLPSQGMTSYTSSGLSIPHLILPVASLALAETAFKVRIMRASMIEVLGQDYIDTARSKGLSAHEVLRKHGILNSMLPMVSVIGYSLGFTIAGSVLIEKVFGWPGMGLLMYDSIQRSENMVVMGILLIVTVTVVIINILTDVAYGLVDPRVRARFRREAGVRP
ncbi:ABC transporter permease [Agromyces aerolatus]|uniref:ABC transporter permease n=1 Tax=Agromyces sp. LY-1074 TaxID=3074080 RepID=UPI002856EC72|nr:MULTISPECIES: ABC transporter permease [unclassified Agromyces]MDR5699466.1 ABC transporter permease [Agromyces sp. LY-1074]MDR5705762.1 ABC transporter permease [Agromyces sp. LY-1358]